MKELDPRLNAAWWALRIGLGASPIIAPIVDSNCSKKVADAPDSHSRECALKCEASGYGIITSGKRFLKCDSAGNREIATALKASTKKDHLRVDISGDIQGDTLKVTSVKLL